MAKPRYKTPEEMQEQIDRYFRDCEGELLRDNDGRPMLDKSGAPVMIHVHPPTMTGLALALGFTSRQALLNYKAKARFVDAITRARARVEQYTEERLFDRDTARGAEFSLRHNFRWREEETAAQSGGGVVIVPPVLGFTEAEEEAGDG